MNDVIPLSGLVARLALNENLSEAQASTFINAFFGIIEQSLAKGESVTVKGLGTFDVADGQVVYTPDEQMASAANAPFEMFSAMAIADDLDLSDIIETEQPQTIVEQEPAPEPPVVPEPESVPEPEPVFIIEEEVVPKPETIVISQPEVLPKPEPKVVPQPVVEPEPKPQTAPEPQSEPEPQPAPEPQPQAPQIVYLESKPRTNRCCIALWGILGLVVGMLIGISAGYVGRDKISMLLASSPAAAPVDSVSVATPDSVAQNPVDTATVVITEEEVAALNDPTTDPENVAEQPVEKTAAEPVYDTISRKRYLTTMAREYYGHQDYWVYIYQANATKLRHPDRIKPGTKVLIPDFETYRTSDDPKQNLRNARNLGAEIYARYN